MDLECLKFEATIACQESLIDSMSVDSSGEGGETSKGAEASKNKKPLTPSHHYDTTCFEAPTIPHCYPCPPAGYKN